MMIQVVNIKKDLQNSALPRKKNDLVDEENLTHLVDNITNLAQTARHSEYRPAAPQTLPDFYRIQNRTGHFFRVSDAIAILAAFLCGGLIARGIDVWYLHGGFQEMLSAGSFKQFAIFTCVCLAAMMWFDTKGHYHQRLPHWETVSHILLVTFIGLVCGGFVQFAFKEPFSRLWVMLSWFVFAGFVFIGRHISYRLLRKNGQWDIPAIIIGEGLTAQNVADALRREANMGYTIRRFVPAPVMEKLTRTHEWKSLLMRSEASHVFIALEGAEMERHGAALKALARAWVPFSIVPPWPGLPSRTLTSHHFMMQDVFLLHDTNRLQLPLPCFIKRSFDIVISSLALLMLLVPFMIIALIVKRDGGKAFFTQQRVGRNGKLFPCYKFRSMRSDAEDYLHKYLAEHPEAAAEWKKYQKLKNDVRVTPFGQFMRRTSIDELPQFYNVLRGDMSLVGPRPIMPGQESFYAEDFCFYESVRPGITGPWQVSGRSKLTFKQRVELESWYARNWSLWVDVVILLKTIPTLLQRGSAV